MEEALFNEDVKNRLMFAAVQELEEHGVNDFSLRRVASRAQVSCAAPYRHFKSREDLIIAVLVFIREQFFLFCEAVKAAHGADARALCIELAISEVRFWVASPKLFSVLLMSASDSAYREEIDAIDAPLAAAIRTLYPTDSERVLTEVLSRVLGYSVLLVRDGVQNNEETFATLRLDLERCFVTVTQVTKG